MTMNWACSGLKMRVRHLSSGALVSFVCVVCVFGGAGMCVEARDQHRMSCSVVLHFFL